MSTYQPERTNEMNIIVKAIATTIKLIVILILALVIIGAVALAFVYQQQCGFGDDLLDLSANQIYNRATGSCESPSLAMLNSYIQ